MPRGGKRNGAGRPANDPWLILEIGGRCAELLQKAKDERWQQAVDAMPRQAEYEELTHEVKAMTAQGRAEFLRSARYRDYLDDIEGIRRDMRGMSDKSNRKAGGFFRVAPKRVHGIWDGIFAEVAVAMTEKKGRRISKRTVERVWKEYCKIIQEIEAKSE